MQATAGIALENARLDAELRARLEELRGSRARIVEAAQSERQLLERNLHDGAQQRLIALSLELSMLKGRVDGDPDVKAGIDKARREIAASLAELREISEGCTLRSSAATGSQSRSNSSPRGPRCRWS